MTQHTYAVVLVTLLIVGGGVGTLVCTYIIMRPIMAARRAARLEAWERQARLIRIVQAYQDDLQYRKARCKELAEQVARMERVK